MMSNIKVYDVEKHFYMQVEETVPIGNGTSKTIWHWDVYIASKGSTYYGRAEEKTKGTVIGWMELEAFDYLEEIKSLVVQRSKNKYRKA
ncbi:hypothetical protein [Bacillus subtilis]|uniref:hypothetical protein n=1 Tax=Bacillus subtilis TaxID=1423 RepID=UPI0015E7AA72|nr:hypothetical protein [Bacillus subtilis]